MAGTARPWNAGSCISAADVAGYSGLIGVNREEGALTALRGGGEAGMPQPPLTGGRGEAFSSLFGLRSFLIARPG